MNASCFLLRCVTLLVIALAWYFNVLLLSVPLTLWLTYQFRAYELIFLGMMFDMYFLSSWSIPYYTVLFVFCVFGMQFLKPRLRYSSTV